MYMHLFTSVVYYDNAILVGRQLPAKSLSLLSSRTVYG